MRHRHRRDPQERTLRVWQTRGLEDAIKLDGDFGNKFSDQSCSDAAGVACDELTTAIHERTLVDQIDDPEFTYSVAKIVARLDPRSRWRVACVTSITS